MVPMRKNEWINSSSIEGILESYRLVSQVMRPGAKNMTIPRVTKTAMTPQTILRALRVRLWKRKLIG